MKLGTFQSDDRGTFSGNLSALGVGVIRLTFEPETSKDGRPYLRVIADPSGDAYEVGAAFEKEKDGVTYYSLNLDSPAFSAPMKAALFPARNRDGFYNLVWDRAERQKQEPQQQPPKSKARTGKRAAPTPQA